MFSANQMSRKDLDIPNSASKNTLVGRHMWKTVGCCLPHKTAVFGSTQHTINCFLLFLEVLMQEIVTAQVLMSSYSKT